MTDAIEDALRRWARATDPARDPVTGEEVRGITIPSTDHHPPRRWAMAAAVLASVALMSGGLWVTTRDGGEGQVVSANDPVPPTVAGGQPVSTQVIVDAPDLGIDEVEALHVVALTAACGEPADAPCGSAGPETVQPLLEGTTLISDVPLPAGSTWSLTYERWTCPPVPDPANLPAGAPTRACGLTTPEGRPVGEAAPIQAECTADLTVAHRAARLVLHVEGEPEGEPRCAVTTEEGSPPLTVPPAFTRRAELPWTCGAGAWDAGSFTGQSDPAAVQAAEACLISAFTAGTPTEMPTTELQGSDDTRPAWWRVVLSDETRGVPRVEIFRSDIFREAGVDQDRWTVQRCSGVEMSINGPVATDCEPKVELSLEVPPL